MEESDPKRAQKGLKIKLNTVLGISKFNYDAMTPNSESQYLLSTEEGEIYTLDFLKDANHLDNWDLDYRCSLSFKDTDHELDLQQIEANQGEEIIGVRDVSFRSRNLCVIVKKAGIEIYDILCSRKQTTYLNVQKHDDIIVHHPLWITKIPTNLVIPTPSSIF